jgi:2-C-methyl-D-erythritol 4-phosphate cytidylyltransferase
MGRPKQFLDLLGEPALLHSLRAFENTPEVSRVYVVGDGQKIKDLAREARLRKFAGCAPPGTSRPLSTKSGLGLCGEGDETVALIHDGSRCLVTPNVIRRVLEACSALATGEAEGVIPALPVSDTIKLSENGTVVQETVDRSRLQAVQTPQAFSLGLLRRIYEADDESLATATDDASLVERAGGRVLLVRGERTNIKLTTPEDLVLAEAILAVRRRRG